MLVLAMLALGLGGRASDAASAPTVSLVVRDEAGRPVQRARVGRVLRFVAVPAGGATLPRGVEICVGSPRAAQCSGTVAPSPFVVTVTDAVLERHSLTGRIVRSEAVLVSRTLPATGYADARLSILNGAGKPVRSARVGDVLRLGARAPAGAALTKWMRVCVDRAVGQHCAAPSRPYVLLVRVEHGFVVHGALTAHVIEFGKTWATQTISVSG